MATSQDYLLLHDIYTMHSIVKTLFHVSPHTKNLSHSLRECRGVAFDAHVRLERVSVEQEKAGDTAVCIARCCSNVPPVGTHGHTHLSFEKVWDADGVSSRSSKSGGCAAWGWLCASRDTVLTYGPSALTATHTSVGAGMGWCKEQKQHWMRQED